MRKLIKILFFLKILFVFNITDSEYIVCDSWNIDFLWTKFEDICNDGIIYNNVININSFSWSYIDISWWYWWSSNSFTWTVVNNNVVTWLFDMQRETRITKNNPSYDNYLWFIWIKYSNLNIWSDYNTPIWFFNYHLDTKIEWVDIKYQTPVWLLTWYINKNTSLWRKQDFIEQEITYREFLKDIFNTWLKINFLKQGYFKTEYDIFINNLLDMFFYENWLWNNIILKENQDNLIKQFRENNMIKTNIEKLINNMVAINNSFKEINNYNYKMYIIDYYLKIE
jgi:hypothetical protein